MAIVEISNVTDMKRQPAQGFPRPMSAQMEQGMPATSKAQFRFMKGVQSGAIKKSGLSTSEAAEFTRGQSPKGLPNKVKRHKVSFPKPTRPK